MPPPASSPITTDTLNQELRDEIARLSEEQRKEYERGYAAAKVAATMELCMIGKGSFGAIYAYPLQMTVYKVVLDDGPSSGEKLLDEFNL